jgi:hypothetical protein
MIMLKTCQYCGSRGAKNAYLMNITALPAMSMGFRPTESMIALQDSAHELQHLW